MDCWKARTCRRAPRLCAQWARPSSAMQLGWSVHGVGVGGLLQPETALDMGNSGTSARLLMGLVASHAITATFTGDASLSRRPMGRVTQPLSYGRSGVPHRARRSPAHHGRRLLSGRSPRLHPAPAERAGEKRAAARWAEHTGNYAYRRAGPVARPYRTYAAWVRGRPDRSRRRRQVAFYRCTGSRSCARNTSPFPAIRLPQPFLSLPRCWSPEAT